MDVSRILEAGAAGRRRPGPSKSTSPCSTRHASRSLAGVLSACTVAGCTATAGRPPPVTGGYTTPLPEFIGEAYMLADGEIVMNLRAEAPGGVIGDGQARFKPTNPDYARVKAHLGPDLRPNGPKVSVRPFGPD